MKKLILVLSVVAMAAFLLVGCLPKANTASVITYNPSQTAKVGIEFTSTVTATDADVEDTLAFSISDEPTDMVIDSATGVISGWTPAAAGTETVLVSVTDGTATSTLPVTITVTDTEPVELDITIAVATETLPDADGKIYVKGGSREIIVTFPDVVEDPVVKVGIVEVPVITFDNKVFKGTGPFVGDAAVLIKVSGVCDTDLCAAKSVVVDSTKPVVELEAKAAECACEDSYALTITSEQITCEGCVADPGCCKDAGSGIASWNVKIFDEDPWEVPDVDDDECDPPDCPPCCSDDPCIEPIAELDGTACPIVITTECIDPEIVWDDVWDEFVPQTYFEKFYWVIATLTDNVGNETTYYGLVSPSGAKAENYVNYFIEIYHGDDTVPADYEPWGYSCWCPAEAWDDADSVIGDCDGLPATECYVEPIPALTCPTVTPDTTIVGVATTITLDFNRDVVESVDGKIMAYISDAAKSTPLNIPDNALPLFLVQDAVNKDIFTGEVTFETSGSKVLYVLWGCETCEPCMYEINVTPIEDCPEIAWFNSDGSGLTTGVNGTVDADGVTWLKGGNTYRFRLTFDHVITDQEKYAVEIKSFDSSGLILHWGRIFYDYRTLADMTTTDNKVFRGNFTPPTALANEAEYCTEAYVIVQVLEPADCCDPCMFKFGVDATLPRAEIEIDAVEACNSAFLEFSSVDTSSDCGDVGCCGDGQDCTSLVGWAIDIFDTIPLWDCCNLVTTPVCEFEGSLCPIDVRLADYTCADCCLDTGDVWIVTYLTDAVGNPNNYSVQLTITSTTTFTDMLEYASGWSCDPTDDSGDDTPFTGTPVSITDDKYGDACPW